MLNYRDAWKLADNLTVHQIVSLIYDYDPKAKPNYFEPNKYNPKFNNLREILETSVECGYIKAQIVRAHMPEPTETDSVIFDIVRPYCDEGTDGYLTISDNNGKNQFDYYPYIDWGKTTVDVNDLKRWFAYKGFKPNFFFTESEQASDLRNPDAPFYAQKLHVAIDAWEHVIYDPAYMNGKTPRAAISKYAEQHASEYRNPKLISSKQAKKDIAKVANWQKGGGAPKSLYDIPERTQPSLSLISPENELYEWQFADEINIWNAAKLITDALDNKEEIDEISSNIKNDVNSFNAILTSILNAVRYKSIKATIRKSVYSRDYHNIPTNHGKISDFIYHNDGIEHKLSLDFLIYHTDVNCILTTISVQDFKRWLESKGYRPKVFFSLDDHIPEYCNPTHHSFSISLKAAYDAWLYTIDNRDLINKHSFTEVVQDYFKDNSELYIHKDEPLSDEIIENITRVINWTQG